MKKDNVVSVLIHSLKGNLFLIILETGVLTIAVKAFQLHLDWEIIFLILVLPVALAHFFIFFRFFEGEEAKRKGVTRGQLKVLNKKASWLMDYKEPIREERDTTEEKIIHLAERITRLRRDKEEAIEIGFDTEHIMKELTWAGEEKERELNYLRSLDAIIEEVDDKITEIRDDPQGFLERMESRERLKKIQD